VTVPPRQQTILRTRREFFTGMASGVPGPYRRLTYRFQGLNQRLTTVTRQAQVLSELLA
jgi:hypothetical protein